ncbi:hypothetical protein N7456_008501 [Penicillium angulare]|uniref:Uncharacterized protein n=1 Tax=Penicillium angulare TaxID=116970 RepID=A0A9W9FCW6_9EURO|nr:hypothetical protein N7456_008501 [Penicillium angulare]
MHLCSRPFRPIPKTLRIKRTIPVQGHCIAAHGSHAHFPVRNGMQPAHMTEIRSTEFGAGMRHELLGGQDLNLTHW